MRSRAGPVRGGAGGGRRDCREYGGRGGGGRRHHHQPADAEGRARDGADNRPCEGERPHVIETSTLALGDKSEVQRILGEAGHTALDCPISGTGAQAKGKDIVVYASGDAAIIKRPESAFLGFARKIYDLGAYGATAAR